MQNLDFIPLVNAEIPFEKEISNLSSTVFNHGALNNKFYTLWTERKLNKDEFRIFAFNYFNRVHATTHRISLALTRMDDWVSMMQILHNLTDELGHGSTDNVHVLVLSRWIDSLGLKLGLDSNSFWKEYINNTKSVITKETNVFVEETNNLCAIGKMEACGALLAQEWHGYSQLALLYEGFRNYIDLYELDDFHDVSEYFYIHLGKAEKEHKMQANIIAGRNCQTEEEFKILESSFKYYLELLEDFWNSIYDNIQKIK